MRSQSGVLTAPVWVTEPSLSHKLVGEMQLHDWPDPRDSGLTSGRSSSPQEGGSVGRKRGQREDARQIKGRSARVSMLLFYAGARTATVDRLWDHHGS